MAEEVLGLTESDALTALEKWVEGGPPPKLIACHRDTGVIERCRPVFPYPHCWLVIPANAIRRRPSFVPCKISYLNVSMGADLLEPDFWPGTVSGFLLNAGVLPGALRQNCEHVDWPRPRP
jgi:hypothetical protein